MKLFARDPLANPEPLIQRVYAYVAYRIGDGPDAEDITSDVFERAVRYRDRYDAAKGEPLSWLIGIARRCVNGAVRGRGGGDIESVDLPAPGDLEAETVGRLALSAAVSALDERERDLIALRYGADLTARQIGEVLGMRTNTVEVSLHRAVGHLRAALDQEAASGSQVVASGRRPGFSNP